MTRWPQDARRRLEQTALTLFAEQGYAATTVDAIAARAGVSQRTFFRHFSDKEEVLFGNDERLRAALLAGIRAAPDSAGGRELVTAGLHALAAEFDADREALGIRAQVVGSDIALQGRDLAKQARWIDAAAGEVTGRGVDPATAALLMAAGAAAFRHAFAGWVTGTDAGPSLAARLDQALDTLADALR